MRLIDADKLKKSVLDLQDCYNGFSDTYDKACFIGVIDEQPTIKPQTGKWIYQLRDSENEEYRCDQCNKPVGRKTKFCPNCGARMVTE